MISKKQSKFIKSLKIKKYRAQEKSFIVEGKKNVFELISSSYVIRYVLATSECINEHRLFKSVPASQLFEVSSAQLQNLGTFKTNQDCLAVAEMKTFSEHDLDLSKPILALDGVKDPGNLGTIIRTMDWFGLDQLVCSPSTAEVYNPKVINSTMGSIARVRFLYKDLALFIKTAGIAAYGADLVGTELRKWQPEKPSILVMGSESHGISEEVATLLKGKVYIPKSGEAESLNVAVATGIICHHLSS